MQPGQSSALGAATASLKISLPIFVIVWAAGHPVCCLLPSARPRLRLSPPGICPSLRFPWRGSGPSAPACGGLCTYPVLCACVDCRGAGETAGSPASECVSALPGADSVHAMFTSFQWRACTEKLANAWLATLAGGWGMAEMTSSRSCPAWPQVSLAICWRGAEWGLGVNLYKPISGNGGKR